ncbi:MAG: 4a-hydroxytetrahydrobiopterin dehydratase [Candidatus Calescibacterium sp.]|nr:4a-hydroxytetrahydrobiopterin dehydratase [Candidatus Calescibacterium sp.]MDW8132499.1 4a-hydroxytetrahydrobiopterin dehydratase [Candidatus Calescibacterium sp.]
MENLLKKGWKIEDDKLTKDFSFNNFKEAVMFFNALAYLSEKYNHHPDTLISYRNCKVTLFTHSEGKVTHKDIELATKIEEYLT